MQFSDWKSHFQFRNYVVFLCNSTGETPCKMIDVKKNEQNDNNENSRKIYTEEKEEKEDKKSTEVLLTRQNTIKM